MDITGVMEADARDDGLPSSGQPDEASREFGDRVLLAALVAHSTNLGVAAMSSSIEGMTPDRLHHASQWFPRGATLKAAN